MCALENCIFLYIFLILKNWVDVLVLCLVTVVEFCKFFVCVWVLTPSQIYDVHIFSPNVKMLSCFGHCLFCCVQLLELDEVPFFNSYTSLTVEHELQKQLCCEGPKLSDGCFCPRILYGLGNIRKHLLLAHLN